MQSTRKGCEMTDRKEENEDLEQVDALCPECGTAFKTHVDRIVGEHAVPEDRRGAQCPVCGCGHCRIGG